MKMKRKSLETEVRVAGLPKILSRIPLAASLKKKLWRIQ
jgi:hypothetical protein